MKTYQKQIIKKIPLVCFILCMAVAIDYSIAKVAFFVLDPVPVYIVADINVAKAKTEVINVNEGTIREVSMYSSTVGQTDNSPCISADGTNICEVDYNVCATNAFPFNTRLYVDGLGECVVKDRMAKRFQERIDWYAGQGDESYQRAINFGLQKLLVK